MKTMTHCTREDRAWRRSLKTLGGIAASALLMAPLGGMSQETEDQIVTSHGISTFGDLKYPADYSHFDFVNPEAPKGGEISSWGFGTFDSFNPYIVKGVPEGYSTIMFESLMARSHDEPDALYGLLAESITYPEPSRQWAEFKIRPEARFSDGSPVTADDVVFSFEMLSTKGSPIYLIPYQAFEKAEALDESRVRFTFKKGAATRSLPLEAASMPVFARSHFQDRDFTESSAAPMLASGPYTVESANPGQRVVYRKDEDYWGESLPYNSGRNNFDRIVIDYYTDYTSAFEGFKGGAYDFREEYYSKLWATGYDFPEVQQGIVVREEIEDGRPSGAQGFWLNLRREIFKDPRVRLAVAMAFNFEWSNKTLFYGAYARTDSFWENSTLQAEGMPSPEELELLEPLRGLIPDSVFTEPAFSHALSDPDKLADRSQLRAAGHLLDEAGWTLVEGVRKNAEGETLAFEFISDSPSFDRIINPFIENLGNLGIEARLRRVDAAQIQLLEDTFEFDVTTRRFSFGLTPGPDIRSAFGSASAHSDGSSNMAGVDNPGVDALLDAVEVASTREDLTVAVKALDRVLRAMHIWVPQWYGGTHRVAYRNKFARPENQAPYTLGELTLWWYDPVLAAQSGAAE